MEMTLEPQHGTIKMMHQTKCLVILATVYCPGCLQAIKPVNLQVEKQRPYLQYEMIYTNTKCYT